MRKKRRRKDLYQFAMDDATKEAIFLMINSSLPKRIRRCLFQYLNGVHDDDMPRFDPIAALDSLANATISLSGEILEMRRAASIKIAPL